MKGLLPSFLLTLCIVSGDIASRDAQPASPPIELFSEAELKCFFKEKVLHSDGNCYKLRQVGPCQNGQWLVLSRNNTASPRQLVCKDMPCDRPLRIYWTEDGLCHRKSDRTTLCPFTNNILRSDSYGEGECACEDQHVRLQTDILKSRETAEEWVGDCYPLYRQGTCARGKVLFPVYMEGHGIVGQCKDDPCPQENNRTAGGGYVKYPGNGQCYELGTRGPCPGDELINVHPQTNKPECYNLVNSLYGNSTLRCDGNINLQTLECRQVLTVKMQNMPYITEVTSKRVKRRG